MTSTAVGAKFTIVYVIGAMAVATGVADALHGSQRAAVTVVAGNICMGAIQAEARLHVVIK